jgi:hypothetical protein
MHNAVPPFLQKHIQQPSFNKQLLDKDLNTEDTESTEEENKA